MLRVMRFTHGVMRAETVPELGSLAVILKDIRAFDDIALHYQAGSRPGWRGTFLCFAKEQVPKRKATRRLGPYASLRAT
ncbi:MAG: hypothetical protein V4451_03150, partial [Pseudomonadota bacterium]